MYLFFLGRERFATFFFFWSEWPPIYCSIWEGMATHLLFYLGGDGHPSIFLFGGAGHLLIFYLGFYLGGDCQIVCLFYLEQLATYLASIWEGMVFVFLFGGAGHLSNFSLGGGGFCFSIWRGWPIYSLFERGWPPIYFHFGRGWPLIYFLFGRGWPPIYFQFGRGWLLFFYLEGLAIY